MAKFDTLIDTFATGINAATWPVLTQGAYYDATRQAVALPLVSGGPVIGTNPNYYDLLGSSVYARLTIPATPTSQHTVDMLLIDSTGANYLQMSVYQEILHITVVKASVTTRIFLGPYIPAQHGPWWRIRETGGITYFETAPDGGGWTVWGQTATVAAFSSLRLQFDSYGPAGGTTTGYVDNVNLFSPWTRLTGAKGDRPLPVMTHHPPARHILQLVNSFVVYDTSWTTPQVYRTWDGLCFLEGLIRKSDNSAFGGQLVCTLPSGFRPADRTLLNGVAAGDGTQCYARVDVDPNGDVTFQSAVSVGVWLSMTGRWYAVQ